MRRSKETDSTKKKGVLHAAFYLIVVALYGWSLIGVGGCAIILLLILFTGDVHVKDNQLLVLGLIMFYPLLWLKRYLEKEWEFKKK